MTTTTPAQPAAQPAALPPFTGQLPGEGLQAYGRRALLYTLTHDSCARLDDVAVEAAAAAVNVTVAAGTLSEITIERLMTVQRTLRASYARRQAAKQAQLAQLAAWLDAQPQPQTGGDDAPSQPQGGSKVPRSKGPRPQGPQGGRVSPDETGQQGSWRAPVAPVYDLVADPF